MTNDLIELASRLGHTYKDNSGYLSAPPEDRMVIDVGVSMGRTMIRQGITRDAAMEAVDVIALQAAAMIGVLSVFIDEATI